MFSGVLAKEMTSLVIGIVSSSGFGNLKFYLEKSFFRLDSTTYFFYLIVYLQRITINFNYRPSEKVLSS